MKWHEKILKENFKEIAASVSSLLALGLAYSVSHFLLGREFEWVLIEPIDLPTIPVRIFYSALTFITLGRLLYVVGFYKGLHDVVVKAFDAWDAYKKIKSTVWVLLMLLVYIILPKIVDALNAILSFCYNVIRLIMYWHPVIGLAAAVFVAVFLLIGEKSTATSGDSV